MPGQVVPAPEATDRVGLIEVPRAAAFTCRYYMRDVSYEAVGMAGSRQRTDVVVTHGLPRSTDPGPAAYTAARSGIAALDDQPDEDPARAIQRAYEQSGRDLRADLGWDLGSSNWGPVRTGLFRKKYPEPPGTAWLAVRVVQESHHAVITYGWVGHSRLYWLPRHGTAEQLTTDHYLSFEDAGPGGVGGLRGMLTHWLEPLQAHDLDTGTRQVTDAGLVVLATAQVWRRFESPDAMAAELDPGSYLDPTRAIDRLMAVEDALQLDDRTVAVVAVS